MQTLHKMESIKEWCSFERYSMEEGLIALEERRVVALIELPNEIIDSILDGRNIPAKIYLPKEASLGTELIEYMAQTGISLLQVAQGEIYATTVLHELYSIEAPLGELYNTINLYNLNLAMNREQLFKQILLSETEGLDAGSYYGATAIGLITLLFGLLVADLLLEYTQRDKLLHLDRVSHGAQIIGRWKVLTGVNFLWSFVMLIGFRLFLRKEEGLGKNLQVCVENSLYILWIIGCVTALYLLLGHFIKDKMSFMFVVGICTFVSGYVSGYFVPIGLLGQMTKQIAVYLPSTYLHRIYSGILAGQDVGQKLSVLGPIPYVCMALWIVAGIGLSILLRGRRDPI